MSTQSPLDELRSDLARFQQQLNANRHKLTQAEVRALEGSILQLTELINRGIDQDTQNATQAFNQHLRDKRAARGR